MNSRIVAEPTLLRLSAYCVYLAAYVAVFGPAFSATCRGQYALPTTREGLVRTLRHQERLVRSAECEYQSVVTPTSADMVPVLRSYYKLRGNENEAESHIIDETWAQKHSHHIKWWRDGQKERLEEYDLKSTSNIGLTTAFNGQVQRTLRQDGGTPTGFIYSPERSGWSTSNRVHPFAFQFMSFETYYSEIVEKGQDFRLSNERIGDQDYVRVFIRHTLYPSYAFELLFGKGGLLEERRLLNERLEKNHEHWWDVKEIARLSDYRRFDLPQGEPIWFPYHVVIGYYAGQLPDGRLAEWQVETISVKHIRLNVDIPDDRFMLAFPDGTRVFDGLTGQEAWLGPVRPNFTVKPTVSRRNRQVLRIVTGSLASLILFGTVVVYLRRIRRGQSLGNDR